MLHIYFESRIYIVCTTRHPVAKVKNNEEIDK